MLFKFNTIFRIFLWILVLLLFISSFSLQTTALGDENKPDLDIIDNVKIKKKSSSDNFIEGENVECIIKIKNIGDKDINPGKKIEVGLFIDDQTVPLNVNMSNRGLKIGESCFINISWIPNFFDDDLHTFTVNVNYNKNNQIIEDNYSNNRYIFTRKITERPTDIEVIDIYQPEPFIVNKKANVIITVKNIGMDTTESIKGILNSSIDGFLESVIKEYGLNRGEYYNFSFNWTPTHFGNQKISVDFLYSGVTHNPTFYNVEVEVGKLKWWNDSYHYRHFISVEGDGNVSVNLNFTHLLKNIGVFSQSFNNSIRIIEYSNKGEILGIVQKYRFNKSIVYDPILNASGNLLWKVENNALEHYYCVYFDVDINPGNREYLQENNSMIKSGDAEAFIGFIDGWSVDTINPIDGGYALVNETIDIIVETSSKAHSVVANIFCNDDTNYNHYIEFSDDGNLIKWSKENFSFDKDGYWTINVTANDNAGYKNSIQYQIFIGLPDLEILDVKYSIDNIDTFQNIYKDDIVNFSVDIYCHNATLKDIKVEMSIFKSNNNEFIYSKKSNFSFTINKKNTINFLWTVNTTGKLIINLSVDPDNDINESNEDNNIIIKSITISDIPDLDIIQINLPKGTIYEKDNVTFKVIIDNIGKGDAFNYKIKLYVEKASDEGSLIMEFKQEKDEEVFNLKSNNQKTVSLYWNSAEPGEWVVGAQIITNNTKKDNDSTNDCQVAMKKLIVKSYEKNPPIIENKIIYDPINRIQGIPVSITIEVTDDTGINLVEISITKPSGVTRKYNMKKTGNDLYKLIFYDTSEYGLYSIVISAEDNSFHKNNAAYSSNFTVNKDDINPTVSFFNAEPYVQLINENVIIICVANDNIDVEKVEYKVITPDGQNIAKEITVNNNGKYVYNDIYTITGFYTASATIYDSGGNTVKTKSTSFWITKNLDDTDNDGMPNSWEERYGFNPEDASDANKDKDDDGYTNYEEYKIGTHPTKDIFVQNMSVRIKDNVSYLAISIMLFIVLIILGYIGKRRMG